MDQLNEITSCIAFCEFNKKNNLYLNNDIKYVSISSSLSSCGNEAHFSTQWR